MKLPSLITEMTHISYQSSGDLQGKRLPDWLIDHLRNAPTKVRAGQNVAGWLWSACKGLHPYRSESESLSIVMESSAHLRLSQREILKTIRKASGHAWQPDNVAYRPAVSRKPSINHTLRGEIIAGSNVQVDDLWHISPIILDQEAPATEWFIDRLFPKDCLLCCDKSLSDQGIRTREEWRGHLSEYRGLTPSPMSGYTGQKIDGSGLGVRTRDNTGDRRFVIVEMDDLDGVPVPKNHQVRILLHLAEFAPLVMMVDSGGKSIHGWFFCLGTPEASVAAFMRYATSLGADDNFLRKELAARMPDGLRTFDDGRPPVRQLVLWFNFEPLTAVHNQPK